MDPTPVVLVTGAGRGLGRGTAIAAAAAGWSVGINFRSRRDAAEETAAACRAAATSPGQRFELLAGDVASPGDRSSMVGGLLAACGRIDALVNNAGVAPAVRADITDASEESFADLLRTNLQGPYFLTQAVARHWLSRPYPPLLAGGFKIVFVTSISADTASVTRGDYCISKAGLAMAAQLWAVRLAGEGIQVVEIRPGIMATDMTAGVREKYDRLIAGGLVPQRRWGTPDDVGRAVRAVLEDAFPFSTGDILRVDGGFHLRRL